jgi:hypothetical protein
VRLLESFCDRRLGYSRNGIGRIQRLLERARCDIQHSAFCNTHSNLASSGKPVYILVRVGRVDSTHNSSLLDITFKNAKLITTDPFVERILPYQKAHDLVSS